MPACSRYCREPLTLCRASITRWLTYSELPGERVASSACADMSLATDVLKRPGERLARYDRRDRTGAEFVNESA